MSHQSRWVRPSDLGENMVDVGVHKALLVSVLGHPQDLGGHCRDRWDGDVHVVPGGHGKQGGDVGIRAVETSGLWPWTHSRRHTDISLRTDSRSTLVIRRDVWSGLMCSWCFTHFCLVPSLWWVFRMWSMSVFLPSSLMVTNMTEKETANTRFSFSRVKINQWSL